MALPRKASRTAIGWAASTDSTAYLTPEFRAASGGGGDYVSFGGAGFIYPARKRGARGYGEGDTVRTELELKDAGLGAVRFYVNGVEAGCAPWSGGATVYAAVSSEGAGVECVVRSGVLES